MAVFKLLVLGHLAAFIRDDEAAVRLNAQRRVVGGAGVSKVLVRNVAKGAPLLLSVIVRLVGLEHHHPHHGLVRVLGPGLSISASCHGGYIAGHNS